MDEEKGRVTEEGSPIMGDIESNFEGIEEENKKQLRNKIILWSAIALGIIILVILIIVILLITKNKEEEKPTDEPDEITGTPVGKITGIFDVNGEKTKKIRILSEEFQYDKNVAIYIDEKRISYNTWYELNEDDKKKETITVRYEIYQEKFSMKNMFKNADLREVRFSSNKNGKIISMESAFESSVLKIFNFTESFDTSQLTSMKNAFAECANLENINFDKMLLTNVKDISHIFQGSGITIFNLTKFEFNSVETLDSMFLNCSQLQKVIMPKFESDNLTDISFMSLVVKFLNTSI